MAKIRKSYRNYSDLSAANDALWELTSIYGEDATLKDIASNIDENLGKWEECKTCNGAGYTLITRSFSDPKFITCTACKGTRYVRIKKEKKS